MLQNGFVLYIQLKFFDTDLEKPVNLKWKVGNGKTCFEKRANGYFEIFRNFGAESALLELMKNMFNTFVIIIIIKLIY